MRYLKRFDENSHDWASNAMPWASDEEIINARFGDAHSKRQEHPGGRDSWMRLRQEHPNATDEEIDRMVSIEQGEEEAHAKPAPELPAASEIEDEEELEDEEAPAGISSRIKSFFGFGR
jgi:hypothetical protein